MPKRSQFKTTLKRHKCAKRAQRTNTLYNNTQTRKMCKRSQNKNKQHTNMQKRANRANAHYTLKSLKKYLVVYYLCTHVQAYRYGQQNIRSAIRMKDERFVTAGR